MSDELAIREEDGALRVVEALAAGAPARLEDFAESLEMRIAQLAAHLNDPQALAAVRAFTKARAGLALHGVGIARLVEIAEKGNAKQALAAINLLGKLSGDLRPTGVQVRVSFDELLRRRSESEGGAGPLAGITDIKDYIIEAELTCEADEEDRDD